MPMNDTDSWTKYSRNENVKLNQIALYRLALKVKQCHKMNVFLFFLSCICCTDTVFCLFIHFTFFTIILSSAFFVCVCVTVHRSVELTLLIILDLEAGFLYCCPDCPSCLALLSLYSFIAAQITQVAWPIQ